MTRPLISTITPAYNPGAFLRDAVSSVVHQTYRNWELLVVDDASTEDLSWVDDVDPRVRRLRSDQHGGASVSRNKGIRATRGEYVAFLDQDDRWHPTKLERQADLFSSGAILCHTAFDLIDGLGTLIGPGYGRAVGYLDMLAGELGVLQSSAVVRRDALEAVGLFHPLLRMQQDLDLFLRLARLGRISFVDSVEVDYRIHGGNASRDYWRAIREMLLVYDLHELEAQSNNDLGALEALEGGRRTVRRTYSYQAIDAARDSLRRGRRCDAAVAIGRSLRLSPSVVVRSTRSLIRTRTHCGKGAS